MRRKVPVNKAGKKQQREERAKKVQGDKSVREREKAQRATRVKVVEKKQREEQLEREAKAVAAMKGTRTKETDIASESRMRKAISQTTKHPRRTNQKLRPLERTQTDQVATGRIPSARTATRRMMPITEASLCQNGRTLASSLSSNTVNMRCDSCK
jgi:hypothetical protein